MQRNRNTADVSPLDVLQLVLGRISDPERRALIEQTRHTRPELWECLVEDLPEQMPEAPPGPDATMDCIPEVVDGYFAQCEEVCCTIDEVAKVLKASPDRRKLETHQPLLSCWKAERYGGKTVAVSHDRMAECADGSRAQLPDLPEAPYVVPFGNQIFIAQPEEAVPYGVVRVLASVHGRPLASIVRIMEWDGNDRQWDLMVATTELFGRDVPDDDIDYHVQPACRRLFAWFAADEIERMAAQVPTSRVKEHEGLQALLQDLKEWEHGK